MVAVDPLASLEIEDIYVTIGGREYRMSGRSAAVWLRTILGDDYTLILPAWLDEDQEVLLMDRLMDDEFTVQEMDEAVLDVISIAAGRPWWWAMQLIMYAASDVHHWARVNGKLVLAGVDNSRITLAAWIDAVYALFIDGMDREDYDKFKAQIDTPPTADLLNEEEEAEAFLSMMG
jgi:hypothetical protein